MPLLTTSEALNVSDSFLLTLYGDDIFKRWKDLKEEIGFVTERDYVSWLIDVANHYKNEEISGNDMVADTIINSEYPEEEEVKKEDASQSLYKQRNTCTSSSHNYSIQSHSSGQQAVKYHSTCTERVGRPTHNLSGKENLKVAEKKAVKRNSSALALPSHHTADNCSNAKLKYEDREYGATGTEQIAATADGVTNMADNRGSYSEMKYVPTPATTDEIVLSDDDEEEETDAYRPGGLYGDTTTYDDEEMPDAAAGSYPCEYCNYSGRQRFSLVTHLIAKHGYKSKHVCDMCGKCFPTPSKRNIHAQGKCKENHLLKLSNLT